ncbi:MAG: SGNH/GDSL hydrolase family protein [Spirochaetales bacterium]|nr:SGNH/GDSL hydrolase family protein [Spirochaetales bacterium]
MSTDKVIKDGDLVLFQGDSITDCGRLDSSDGLGSGYVSIIRGTIACLPDAPRIRIVNRGIGGDRTEELLARWKQDCEDLKPDVLSLKIGVNDVWRIAGEWNGQTYIGPEQYEANYRILLDRALTAGVRQLVLCSPTTIENNTDNQLSGLLAERVEIVKKLAKAYGAAYVPFAEYQLDLLARKPEVKWTQDGCHPTTAGHSALAWCWLETMGFFGQ